METPYDPQAVETAAQEKWARERAYEVTEDPGREKFYCLSMLPYPSGAFHMGHVRNYTIGDLISRYQRMCGKNVLQPMGWDAFGLPAENAAIKQNVPPACWTYANIEQMRGQLQRLGYAYDWTRELATCKPEYYRWEQQMFVRLMAKGLVYRRDATVNWDPVDQTVLANEQVIDGKGWRSGAEVELREIPQWFLKITAYADELLDGLDELDGWPDAVKTMQRNWIGRSEGAEFDMEFCDPEGEPLADGGSVTVFTTRPDTSFGMTYAVLAPEHPLVAKTTAPERRDEVEAFVAETRGRSEADRAEGHADKRGVFTGAYLKNPFNRRPVPVYIADYVLMSYGTGAIMAVPGQDQRDWDFATAHGLPIVRTVQPPEGFGDDEPYLGDGPAINSEWLDGLGVTAAKAKAIEWLESQGIGRRRINYRLRDWGVSRQRYWGCPIPVIHCPECGPVPVPEADLPVVLPEDVRFMGVASPIKADPEWRRTTCPDCAGPAERETDTFDTFMESSWYYARYCCPDAGAMLDERANYWLPVDQYIGGIEHAILHLMYFRFYHKLMRDAGLVRSDEPATRLLCQGMVVAETYYRDADDGARHYFNPAEVEVERDDQGRVCGARLAADGEPVVVGPIEKMSKSKNNGVDPQSLVERYGADTVRLFAVFTAPPEQALEWSEAGVEGAYRFLKRLWKYVHDHVAAGPVATLAPTGLSSAQRELRAKLHETIAKVSDAIGRRLHFNSIVAAVMELVNAIARHPDAGEQDRAVAQETWENVVLMLAPITPHVCDALWAALGRDEALLDHPWPVADEAAMRRDEVEIVVQVNGRLRGRIRAAPGSERETLEAAALAEENVARFVAGNQVRKIIVVPDKLVNIVVTG